MKSEFKTYHPIVNFTYFVVIIGFSMAFMNPVILFTSFVSSLLFFAVINGKKCALTRFLYLFPFVIFMALLNPLFNHQGVTILAYFPNGNALTFESVFYGAVSATMVFSVIIWFSCYSEIMTSDKFIYLFGKTAPSFALIFSMTLRLVPKFINQIKLQMQAQKTMGKDIDSGSLLKRIKNGTAVISSVTSWSLENAVDISDSMRARGYGLKRRTSFSVFKISLKDIRALLFIVVLSVYLLIGVMLGKTKFIFYPSIEYEKITFYGITLYIAFLLLCTMPVIIELWGAIRWKYLKRKI